MILEPEQISVFIFNNIKKCAESKNGEPIEDCVITVSANLMTTKEEQRKMKLQNLF